jgi:acetyl esterase/lipase
VAIADYDLVSQGVTVENQIHAVAKMLKYLYDHAAELGIADDAFFISGDS